MVKIKEKITTIFNFSSIGEFLDTAEKSEYDGNKGKTGGWAFSENAECNTKTKSYKLLRAGRGLSTVRKLSKKYRHEFENSELADIMNRVQNIKRKRKFNDFDGNLDFDRVMSGNPEYWDKVQRSCQSKVVRIGINFCLSFGNKIDDFSRIVALSAVFAEILENLGYGVEIYGSGMYQKHAGDKGKKFRGILFPVKSVTERLDFDRIYSLGLTGLLRDAHFRAEITEFGYYGGRAEDIPQDVIKLADIDVLITKSWTGENQTEKIIQVIKEL